MAKKRKASGKATRARKRPARVRTRPKSVAKPKARRAKPARTAKRRRPAPRPARKAAGSARKTRRPARKARRPARPARRPVKKAAKTVKKAASRPAAPKRPAPKAKTKARVATPIPRLDRTRRTLPDVERLEFERDTADARLESSARAGHNEMLAELKQHTESSPRLTGGDVDARWQDAYAEGDEAPGGDNPTPDQDRVDEIGQALGVNYQDNEELQGGDEILDRDDHRWELDPASSDDWPHDRRGRKDED